MAEFLLKINCFEIGNEVKQKIYGNAIETNFALPYACIFKNNSEIKLLKSQHLQLLVVFHYIDDIFFHLDP